MAKWVHSKNEEEGRERISLFEPSFASNPITDILVNRYCDLAREKDVRDPIGPSRRKTPLSKQIDKKGLNLSKAFMKSNLQTRSLVPDFLAWCKISFVQRKLSMMLLPLI